MKVQRLSPHLVCHATPISINTVAQTRQHYQCVEDGSFSVRSLTPIHPRTTEAAKK